MTLSSATHLDQGYFSTFQTEVSSIVGDWDTFDRWEQLYEKVDSVMQSTLFKRAILVYCVLKVVTTLKRVIEVRNSYKKVENDNILSTQCRAVVDARQDLFNEKVRLISAVSETGYWVGSGGVTGAPLLSGLKGFGYIGGSVSSALMANRAWDWITRVRPEGKGLTLDRKLYGFMVLMMHVATVASSVISVVALFFPHPVFYLIGMGAMGLSIVLDVVSTPYQWFLKYKYR